jgi:PAS domain S-box-containing protein
VHVLESLRAHAVFLLDPEGVIQPWDVGGEQIEGFSSAQLVGRHLSALYPPGQVRDSKPAADLELAADVGRFEEEAWRVRQDGTRFWARVVINALRDGSSRLVGFTKIVADLTERQTAEELRRELVRERGFRTRSDAAVGRMRTLLEASLLLSAYLDPGQGVTQFARLLVPEIADWCAVHLLDADGTVRGAEIVHRDPGREPTADSPTPVGVEQVLRTGHSLLLPVVEQELLARMAKDDRQRAILEQLGMESAMIVPLLARGHAVGTVTLVTTGSHRQYGATDLMLAEDLAARAALALDNARLYTEAREEIEAREKAEAELRLAHARMEVILQGVRSGITVHDADGRLVYANNAAAEMVGYGSGSELLEAPIAAVLGRLEIMDESGAPLPRSELPGRRAPSDDDSAEERILRYRVKATGAEYWSRVRSKAILADEDGATLSINIFHDVTERVQVERARQEDAKIVDALHRIGQSLAKQLDLETIVQEVTDTATALTDAELGTFVYDLSGGEAVSYRRHAYGATPHGLFDRHAVPGGTPFFTSVFDERIAVRTDDASKDPRCTEMERLFGLPDGGAVVRSCLAVPVRSRDGRVMGALVLGHRDRGVFGERHERVAVGVAGWASVAMDNARLYDEEHRARTDAEEANRVKADFLATVSHELRTPLNAMIGYTDLLVQGIPEPIPSGPRERVARIGANARHVRELIEELLVFSRLEAGQEVATFETVELGSLFAEVRALIEPLTQTQGLSFVVRALDVPMEIESNARRLRQILMNLIGNAVKFTPAGEVALAAERVEGAVLIHVSDTGAGIDPADIERVFEPFYQVDRTVTRGMGGTGLGLSVTRKLCRLLGGDVTVRSEVGRGSTFTVRLPDRLAGRSS